MQRHHDKFEQLRKLGAGEFAHFNGSLESHLVGTYSLLKSWQAEDDLCDAGLYHAAYGTAGFKENMLSVNKRDDIAAIIGKRAEAIVYLYCACDRQFVFEKIKAAQPILFRDRFSGECFSLSQQQSYDFCELTVANELEIARNSDEFIRQHGAALIRLFVAMRSYLSEAANQEIKNVFGESQLNGE